MRSHLITILVGLIILSTGYFFINKSENTVTKQDYELAEQLCKSSEKTVGIIENEYTELKIKGIKMNTYKYKYSVSGSNYFAERMLLSTVKNTDLQIAIWYNPNNPSVYMLEEPCYKKTDFENNKTIGNKQLYFWMGLLMGLLMGLFGAFLTFGAIINFVKFLFKK